MSTLLNTESTYQSLQPFQSVDELNENTIAVREQYADQLTPSTIKVLDVLHRYACKYPGVSYLSKSTIAEMVGISRRTVIRSCNQLEDLGIIVQHELKRRNGDRRQSSNAIVFVKQEEQENVEETTMSHHVAHQDSLSKTQKSINNTLDTDKADFAEKEVVKDFIVDSVDNYKKDVKTVKADVKRGLRDKMPTYLYDLLSPYFNLDDLYQAYGALIRGKAYVDKSIQFETHEGLFSDAVLSVINAYKRGIVRNINAVMYTAARDTSAQIYRQENYSKDNPVARYIKGLF